jgi:integrase/recombinase XerD
MDLSPFSGWLAVYRAPSTREGYLYDVRAFTAWLQSSGVHAARDITYQHCLTYLAERRIGGLGSNALRRIVWAIRGWLEFELGPDHVASNLKAPRARHTIQRSLSADKLRRVLCSCDTSTPQGVRDLAMLALMADCGIRSSEVCRLLVTDLDLDELRLVVQIKGGDDGVGVFSEPTRAYILRWLDVRAPLAHCPEMFVHSYHGTALTTGGLRAIFRRIGRDAGLLAFSPHDMRRTMAMIATELRSPSRVTQVGGRWSSIEQVEDYTRGLAADEFRRYSPVAYVMGPDS